MGKNIVIIHYNTPRLTECLVMSINKFVSDANIYIFDNSDKEPFVNGFENVTIFDNTKGQIINFDKWLEKYPRRRQSHGRTNNWGSAKHAYSVEKCLELMTEPFILMDSDILLKRDVSDLFSDDCVYIGETITQPNSTIKRVAPYLCFINAPLCKKNNVRYFDERYMHGLAYGGNSDKYDTGGAFYIFASKYNHKDIKLSKYITHYGHGSWTKTAKKIVCSENEWLEIHKKLWSDHTNKNVVYTCITGGYDTLKEPKRISPGWDYICFTDDSGLTSDVWEIRQMPKQTDGLSLVKKQRYVKINPHIVLPEYDVSIWVDGNVLVVDDVNEFVSKTKKEGCSVYVPKHPHRNCTYEEARVVVRMKKDTNGNVDPQMERYRQDGFPKNNGMLQSNIMLRYHNDPGCIRLMEKWFSELKDGSHRDQLSFNYALWKNSDVPVTYMDKMIYKSKWFSWQIAHEKLKGKKTSPTVTTVNCATAAPKSQESITARRERAVERIRHMKLMRSRLYW